MTAAQQNTKVFEVVQRLDLSPHRWRASLGSLGMALVACQRDPCAIFLSRMIAAETTRDPEVYRVVRSRATVPILEALAGRLAMLGNAGHLDLPDPALAARQFLALLGAEIPELTEQGTREVPDERIRAAVDAAVDLFVRAHAVRGQVDLGR